MTAPFLAITYTRPPIVKRFGEQGHAQRWLRSARQGGSIYRYAVHLDKYVLHQPMPARPRP